MSVMHKAVFIMAAEVKDIIFYRCNLFIYSLFRQHRWKTSHGISTKLASDLQMPQTFLGTVSPNLGRK